MRRYLKVLLIMGDAEDTALTNGILNLETEMITKPFASKPW